MAKLTKEDKDWRAESDARTLIEAEKVRDDSGRHKAALVKLKVIVEAAKDEISVAGKVSKNKITKEKVTKKPKSKKK